MKSLSPEVSIETKHRDIYAILDFLMECSRNHRLTSRVLEPENSFISIMEDAVLDSTLIMDSHMHRVASPSQDERANVPKKHVVDSLPTFCPPRKGISAIRSFPPGCGRGAPRVRIQDRTKCLRNDGSRTKKKQCHGASSKNADSAGSFSGTNLRESRMQPPVIPRKKSEDLKLLEDRMRKVTGNKDRSTGAEIPRGLRLATGPECMVRRIVVQALMAAPNCPWRQGKRSRKSKPSKIITQGKGL